MTKQPTQLEADVRAGVVPFAKSLGVIHIRMHFGAGATTGYPDDLFLFPNGVSLWVEFKRPGKEAKPIQAFRIKELMDMGHPAVVIDNIGAGRETMQEFMRVALGIQSIAEGGAGAIPDSPAEDAGFSGPAAPFGDAMFT